MKTEYHVMGREVFLGNSEDRPKPLDKLPLGTYNLKFCMKRGYYLELRHPFELPTKLYGNTTFRTERILNTFMDRSGTTGVLLSGVKGSGKSMEAKNISVEGAKLGVSTIVVDFEACGPAFNQFISSIEQPCIVLFDEFEKVFKAESQEALLTLLDGFFNSKKLFVFTANDTGKINSHMINRPGRIYYNISYKGLELEFVKEYCEDRLKDVSKTDVIMQLAEYVDNFNFDMLQTIVEEHNRYKDTKVKELLPLLNIRVDNIAGATYKSRLFINGKPMPKKDYFYPTSVRNPLTQTELSFEYEDKRTLEEMMLAQAKTLQVKDEDKEKLQEIEDDLDDGDARWINFTVDVNKAVISRGKKFIEFTHEHSEDKVFKIVLEKEEWAPLNVLDQLNE